MAWTIDFQDAAIKHLKKMGRSEAARIRDFLHTRVKPLDDPRRLGKPLQGEHFKHLWRYRIGDYRIICDIKDDKLVVLVIEVGHRSKVYR